MLQEPFVEQKIDKIPVSKLMYLDIGLGESDDSQKTIWTKALLDTGCTNSILDWFTFMQIPDFNIIKQEEMKK